MNDLPSPDDLIAMGHAWGHESAIAPDGTPYRRYTIFKYKDKKTYVLENHLVQDGMGYHTKQIVKRLL